MGKSAIRNSAERSERAAEGVERRPAVKPSASNIGPGSDARALTHDAGPRRHSSCQHGEAQGERRADRERRAGERGSATGETAHTSSEAPLQVEYTTALPDRQDLLASFLVLAFVTAAGISRALPPTPALVAMAISMTLLVASPLLAKFERREGAGRATHYAMMALGVIVPQAAAGYAIASWIEVGLAWQWAVATMVCLSAASATLMGSRIISLFTGKIAAWAAFAAVHASPLTVTAVIGAALALMLIARFQWLAAERKRLVSEARERVAARAEDILRSFEETGQGWFWETDRRGLINYISPSAARVIGQEAEALRGQPLTSIIDQRTRSGESQRTLCFHLSARSAIHELELRANTPDGEERWWSLTGRPVYDSFHNFCGFRGHGTDLTEKRRSEQQVTRLAHYDSLTGLANRLQMSAALEQMLAAPREVDRSCAVFMLDLDRFKQVNDTLGHPAGDALLKQVAQRLERVIGERGRCGRLGGDEFQVILPGLVQLDELALLAQNIISTLSQPYSIDGNNVVIGASIGVAIAPLDGTTSEALIRNVDLALYAAKDAGRGVHRFYAPDLHSAAEERAELEQDLRAALARGDLQLHYQPVVIVASEKIVGFEALMRWHHAKRGWIAPDKFIAIAEDAGLIDQLGQWAIRTACADLAKWPETIRCAVNVSPLQFANAELPTIVANALAHAGISPARLELEITESVFLNDSHGTDAMIKALKRVGVRLALDDFGTGYSSLGYLKKAPFDKIKIDQSFVRGPSEDRLRNSAIISSITSLADALNMETTAEGVETLDELEMIRVLGCSHVQGYIYHPPMPAEQAGELVRNSLAASPDGPSAAREPRQVLLRRVTIACNGSRVTANIRNLSEGGAMIEGLWHTQAGQMIEIEFTPGNTVSAQVRWARENRVGVAFPTPLLRGSDGGFAVLRGKPKTAALAKR